MFNDLIDRDYSSFCNKENEEGCFGFCVEVCKRMGIDLPDYRDVVIEATSNEKINKFISRFEKVEKPHPGDLVLMRSTDGKGYHIAVMIGRGKFLQATREHGVFSMRLNNLLCRDRIEGVYRIKNEL